MWSLNSDRGPVFLTFKSYNFITGQGQGKHRKKNCTRSRILNTNHLVHENNALFLSRHLTEYIESCDLRFSWQWWRLLSSGIWSCVVWYVFTKASEECAASVIRAVKAIMTKAENSYKTSVSIYQSTWCHITEKSHVQICLMTSFYQTQNYARTEEIV
jgi:hypothetical protein